MSTPVITKKSLLIVLSLKLKTPKKHFQNRVLWMYRVVEEGNSFIINSQHDEVGTVVVVVCIF